MKKIFNLGSITLSGSGEVKGAESVLDVLTESEINSVSGATEGGGYDPFGSENNRCTNVNECGSSSNKWCKNEASDCENSTNVLKCGK